MASLHKCLALSLALLFGYFIIRFFVLPSKQIESSEKTAKTRSTKDAYVILLTSDNFCLGAQVLTLSLLDTNTTKDRVALCTDNVSQQSRALMQSHGWIIRPVSKIHNPNEGKSRRANYFAGSYTKIHAWNMTEYERVVYLDSDLLVTSNIDHLFDCGTFCVRYRHSGQFNSGVMVIEPSTAVFNDLIKNAPLLPSYNHGDQAFFNVYFKDMLYAPMFNWSDSKRQHQPMNLPPGLNSDIGLYYFEGKWTIPDSEVRIIHFMGSTKPWKWWTNRVLDLSWKWTNVRKRLPSYNCMNSSALDILKQELFWVPYPLMLLVYSLLRYLCQSLQHYGSNKTVSLLRYFNFFNKRFSHFVPLPVLCLSYYLAFAYVVPISMLPSQAEYVFWLWSSLFLLLFMGTYCCFCHVASIRIEGASSPNIPVKLLQSSLLFAVFTISHILHAVIPFAFAPFLRRFAVFTVVSVCHAVLGQATGQMVIYVWTK